MDYYNSFSENMKKRFGKKAYKISLDGGFTCPNRDGTLGYGGCIFCSNFGSGDFASKKTESLDSQIQRAKSLILPKLKGKDAAFIGYFQSYTNTYGSVEKLKEVFLPVINRPDICALSIATRADCLSYEILDFLEDLRAIKPVFIELGLQSIHEKTLKYINRGHGMDVFDKSLKALIARDFEVVVHVILGLPGETREMMLESVKYVANSGAGGIKLHMLHVLLGTKLSDIYEKEPFYIMSLEEYAGLIVDCVALLPPEMVIHRLTGDGHKRDLIAPLWSGDKKRVLNTINGLFKSTNIHQGDRFKLGL